MKNRKELLTLIVSTIIVSGAAVFLVMNVAMMTPTESLWCEGQAYSSQLDRSILVVKDGKEYQVGSVGLCLTQNQAQLADGQAQKITDLTASFVDTVTFGNYDPQEFSKLQANANAYAKSQLSPEIWQKLGNNPIQLIATK